MYSSRAADCVHQQAMRDIRIACWPASRPAIGAVKSPRPGLPPKSCARSRCRDRGHAAARLYAWTAFRIDSYIPELIRLARAISNWRTESLAYFTTGRISNGPPKPSTS